MLSIDLLDELKEYVEFHQAEICAEAIVYKTLEDFQETELDDFINIKRKPTLSELLFKLIDHKGVSDAEIYKKAGIDRRHFSKIRSNPTYKVGKNTAIALAFALELNIQDSVEFLSAAGFSLSDSDTYDLVIQFCLEKQIYDFDRINEALDYFSLKPLL